MKANKKWLLAGGKLILCLSLLFAMEKYVGFGIDNQVEPCLPDLHLAMMFKFTPHQVNAGDMLYWKPSGALSYVKAKYVLKVVAGVPGDHLLIVGDDIRINGVIIASGFPNKNFYTTQSFDRDELIPANSYFMLGANPKSNDSRYWGYLLKPQIAGWAIKVL